MSLSQRCRKLVEKDTNEEAAVLGNQAFDLAGSRGPGWGDGPTQGNGTNLPLLGNLDGLQTSLGNQALILQARGDLDGAMALHKEEERICRQFGNLDGLQTTSATRR